MQERIGYEFADPTLLTLALTHSSHANERGGCDNERLEFLGDGVLDLCVSSELYRRYPGAREGDLSRALDSLVCEAALADLALGLGLDRALILGKGEAENGGREKPSLLADAFEALLAAVYLDGGFAAASGVVARVYAGFWPDALAGTREKDPKSRLQELCHARFGELPVYTLIETSGPDHERVFRVKVTLPDGSEFSGQEKSAKKAGQVAAASALQNL